MGGVQGGNHGSREVKFVQNRPACATPLVRQQPILGPTRRCFDHPYREYAHRLFPLEAPVSPPFFTPPTHTPPPLFFYMFLDIIHSRFFLTDGTSSTTPHPSRIRIRIRTIAQFCMSLLGDFRKQSAPVPLGSDF